MGWTCLWKWNLSAITKCLGWKCVKSTSESQANDSEPGESGATRSHVAVNKFELQLSSGKWEHEFPSQYHSPENTGIHTPKTPQQSAHRGETPKDNHIALPLCERYTR